MSASSPLPREHGFDLTPYLPGAVRMLVLRGALAIIFGLLALIWPDITARSPGI